jgi:adenylate cyclase
MADLFVSYARVDRPQVAPLVAALEAEGWSVWWDPEIAPGQEFDRLIAQELKLARAVIVVWTPTSVTSRWVRGEAREAADRGVLAPVRFDRAELPIDLRAIHTTDLDDWADDAKRPEFRELTRAIRSLLGESDAAAQGPATGPTRKLSVCVLPFINISGDLEQDYFSDGISEDIITDLGKVSALSVVARNTAFTYKGKPIAVAQVARQLGVSHIVEGSVRKAGNRVRITAQLIDGAVGDHLWAERWDRDLTDIFALQDEISQAIVAALKLKLLPNEKRAIERRGTSNPEAFRLYLMARTYSMNGSGGKRGDLVIRLCQRAIDLDADYARAWALLAIARASKAAFSSDAGDVGLEAADRAIGLDSDLAEAHAAKGRILTYQDRMDEAASEIDTALRLDPDSPDVNEAAGTWAMATRRFERAARYYEISAAADETNTSSLVMAIQARDALGDAAAAETLARELLARVEKVIAAEPDNVTAFGNGVSALFTLGDPERAKAWAEHALLLDPDDGRLRYNLACCMAGAGETDYALDWLEQALATSGLGIVRWAESDTDLDSLRGLPRFKALLAQAEDRLGGAGKPRSAARARRPGSRAKGRAAET